MSASRNRLKGLPASGGIAIGRAVCIDDGNAEVLRFQLADEDLASEVERFHTARQSVIRDLSKARERLERDVGDELGGILEAQAMLVADDAFVERVVARISKDGVNAEWAVRRTCDDLAAKFATIETEYLRERGEDLQSIARYLIRSLHGISHHEISEISGDVVVVADELTPVDALRLARQQVVGFVLESGGPTSHTAIVARGLRLPAVFGVAGVTEEVTDADPMVLDGDEGYVLLHPTTADLESARDRQRRAKRRDEELARTTDLESLSRDGVPVELLANLGLLEEIVDARRFGSTGVGLYRTEFLYLEKSPELPSEAELYDLFSALLRGMGTTPPVIVRTLDLADRRLAQEMAIQPEENPVLGLRGIRLMLARPEILRTQLRALFRAALLGDLRVMIPLVTCVEEVRDFRKFCREITTGLESEGIEHRADVPLGAMIEVPAAALISQHLARELDFLSIGTNDLIQYSLAVDRNNEQVAALYQPDHPAILRLLAQIMRETRAEDCEISICGEMAADPILTPFLLGIGLRRLSMSSRSIPIIKERIRALDIQGLDATAEECLAFATAADVRRYLVEKHPVATAD